MAEVPFVILHGKTFIRKFRVTKQLTIGSSDDAQLCFEDSGIPPRWGVVFARDGKMYAQRVGGLAQRIDRGDAISVGPFTLARADAGSKIDKATAGAKPGQDLGWTKDPYDLVVLLGGSDTKRGPAKADTGRLSRPKGLTQLSWGGSGSVRRFKKGLSGGRESKGDGRYDADPIKSAQVERALSNIVREIERGSTDPGEIDRVGHDFLDQLRDLSFPELVALLRELATGFSRNHLEAFYARYLAQSPLLAFRWAAVIVERYSASARGAGRKAALPRLGIGLKTLVSEAATDGFRKAREMGGKMVAGGPW